MDPGGDALALLVSGALCAPPAPLFGPIARFAPQPPDQRGFDWALEAVHGLHEGVRAALGFSMETEAMSARPNIFIVGAGLTGLGAVWRLNKFGNRAGKLIDASAVAG